MKTSDRLLGLLSATPADVEALDAEIHDAIEALDRLRALRRLAAGAAARPEVAPAPCRNGHAPAGRVYAPGRREISLNDDEDLDAGDADDDPPAKGPGAPPRGALREERRRKVVVYIARNGPQRQGAIIREAGIAPGSISKFLDCPWFEHEPDGWHITAEARRDVLAGLAGLPEE